MSFRTRLLLVFLITVAAAVGVVSWIVSATTRRAFERVEDQHISALVTQFRSEFARRGSEVVRRVAKAESMTSNLSRPDADYSQYVYEAQAIAAAYDLDALEIMTADGTILSSAQWTARFGYKEDWLRPEVELDKAFLQKIETQDDTRLALISVHAIAAGDRKIYLAGGQWIDQQFLATLTLPAGMRVLLQRTDQPASEKRLAQLVRDAAQRQAEVTQTIRWSRDAASAETFHAIPLAGRQGNVLGVLLVGSSRREIAVLLTAIRDGGIIVALGGILFALVFTFWTTGKITRPIRELEAGARKLAAGNWNVRVPVRSRDEIGGLAQAFNQMTQELSDQRDRLVQAERVAAWRELARRLAHELKNPLFPLQITVENLERARSRPEMFDEVFQESTHTLLAEIANLKRIVAQFSDFSKMPAPELQQVRLADLARGAMQLFEPQLRKAGIEPVLEVADTGPMRADPEQISRALRNLILNAIDAMPNGGTLTIRTRNGRMEIADTGAGLTPEECERLFTPYYTTKQHGTGLGLAIVQSVVSDHHGRVWVESEPGKGSTFVIELPGRNCNV